MLLLNTPSALSEETLEHSSSPKGCDFEVDTKSFTSQQKSCQGHGLPSDHEHDSQNLGNFTVSPTEKLCLWLDHARTKELYLILICILAERFFSLFEKGILPTLNTNEAKQICLHSPQSHGYSEGVQVGN